MSPSDAELIANEVRYLTQRFDEHAERTDQHFAEVKEKQDETNGRVRDLEGWRRELKGTLSVLGTGARISIVSFIAPTVVAIVVAVITALILAQ